jgi:hypothetical protein
MRLPNIPPSQVTPEQRPLFDKLNTGISIGLGIAELLSAEGARVMVTGRNPERLAAAQRELPGVTVIKSDSASLRGEVKTHAPDLRVDDKFSRHRPPGTPDWHSKAKGISARACLESTPRVLEKI